MGIKVWVDEPMWYDNIKPFSSEISFSEYMTGIITDYNHVCIGADESNIFIHPNDTRTYKQITANPPQSATSYTTYSVSGKRDIQIIDGTYVYTFNASSPYYVLGYKLSTKGDRTSTTTELGQSPSANTDDYIFKVSMDGKYCVFGNLVHSSSGTGIPSLYKLTTPYDLSTMTLIGSTGIDAYCNGRGGPIEFLSNGTDYYLFYYTNERSYSDHYIKQAKLDLTTGACSDIITLGDGYGRNRRFTLGKRYKDGNFVPAIFATKDYSIYYVDCITS